MRRIPALVLGAFATLACAQVVGRGDVLSRLQLLDFKRDFIETPSQAYAVLAPEYIGSPQVNSFEWSADGQYLMVLRKKQPVEIESLIDPPDSKPTEVIIYGLQQRKSVRAAPLSLDNGDLARAGWAGSTHSVYLELVENRPSGPDSPQPYQRVVGHLLGADGSTVELFSAVVGQQGQAVPRIEMDPNSSYAFLDARNNGGELTLVDLQNYSRVLVASASQCVFAAKGEPAILEVTVNRNAKTRTTTLRRVRKDGSLAAAEPIPDLPRPVQKPVPLTFHRGNGTVTLGASKQNVRPLLLQSTSGGPQPSVVLSYNGYGLSLSPTLDAVAYVNAEGVFVRRIVKVSLEELKKIKAASEKRVLSARAKEFALALLMYGADYDDILPAHAEGVDGMVNPYMRDQLDPSGVHFLLAGGNLSKYDNPSTTVMGYIQGSTGTAYLYVDGHVHWVPN